MCVADWQHEEQLVQWLLAYYELYETRTRFMLLDEEEQFASPQRNTLISEYSPPRRKLTLRAFDSFFQFQFPLRLDFISLSTQQAQKLTGLRLISSLDRTRLHRDFYRVLEGADSRRAIGIVYHWPHLRDVGQSVVVHNSHPVDPRVPGAHFVWRDSDGTMMVIETLATMVRSLDAKFAPHEWQMRAKHQGYRTPLSDKSIDDNTN